MYGNQSVTQAQQEMMERIPDSLSKMGIVFLLSIIFIVVILSFIIRYPDTLSGKAILNSSHSAISLVMPVSGKIELLVPSRSYVEENEILAVVDNPANYKDVLFVRDAIGDFLQMDRTDYQLLSSRLLPNLELGEIKVIYMRFLIALNAMLKQSDYLIYRQEIESIKENLRISRSNLEAQRDILSIQNEKLKLLKIELSRDSLLYKKGLISESDYETSISVFLQQKTQYQESFLSLRKDEQNILLLQNEISTISLQIKKNEEISYNSLADRYMELSAMIESWEKKYLIQSPIQGTLEYAQFLSSSQYVTMDTSLFNIMPKECVTEVEVLLPSDGVGKIEIGHKAIIKLMDYPSKEYGDLSGYVSEISLSKKNTEDANLSLIKVQLENEGRTNYGRSIKLHFGMPATVDIVTENRRLISRIFDRMKYVSRYGH